MPELRGVEILRVLVHCICSFFFKIKFKVLVLTFTYNYNICFTYAKHMLQILL
jgi:hypothetical protein